MYKYEKRDVESVKEKEFKKELAEVETLAGLISLIEKYKHFLQNNIDFFRQLKDVDLILDTLQNLMNGTTSIHDLPIDFDIQRIATELLEKELEAIEHSDPRRFMEIKIINARNKSALKEIVENWLNILITFGDIRKNTTVEMVLTFFYEYTFSKMKIKINSQQEHK